MTGTISSLALAVAVFVGGHFILSSLTVRRPLSEALGENLFRGLYSLVALASLVWVIAAYRAAPYRELWSVGPQLLHVPLLLMPLSCVLVVAGLSTRSVTMVGGELMAGDPDPVSGITTITRHPFLWGIALWALSHLAANGDMAGLVLFGGMTLLSLGGMAHIDYRRSVTLGSNWGPIAMTTSAIPFLAALQGRRNIDWRGIGWSRLVAGLVLYILLPFLHPWIAGVPIAPHFLLDMIG